MNILFFTYDLPYPLTTGGKIRAYHLLKKLSQKHTVTLVSFYRNDHQLDHLKNLSFLEKIHTFKRRNLYSAGSMPYLFKYPFPAALYFDPLVQDKADILCKSGQFDVVHYESFYTTVYMNPSLSIPQIVGTENIEWHVYKQYLDQQSFVVQPFLKSEINRIKKFEELTWKQASSCIAVSEENKEIIENAAGAKCEVVPNGVDLDMFMFKKRVLKKDKLRFLFVGSMQYIQNKDAATWLVSSIWPKIKEVLVKHNVAGTLSIVGPGTDQLAITDDSIALGGEVSDIVGVYKEHDILLAPLRAGSGTKFKVLESAAVGNIVVTTEVGMEGLDGFSDREELLLANNPEEFAESIEFILTHPEKAALIAKNARNAVEKYHSWDYVGKKLLKYYETIINHHH